MHEHCECLGMTMDAYRVVESTTHQELQRQIVSALGVLARIVELCLVPVDQQVVSSGERGGLVRSEIIYSTPVNYLRAMSRSSCYAPRL